MFTINNPKKQNPLLWPGVKFLVYQKEQGDKGTPHLQGYVQFEKPKRLSGCKKVDPTAHWEARMGTHEEAVNYCTKKDTRIGSPIRRGVPRVVAKAKKTKVLVLLKEICLLIFRTICSLHLTALIWRRCIP